MHEAYKAFNTYAYNSITFTCEAYDIKADSPRNFHINETIGVGYTNCYEIGGRPKER